MYLAFNINENQEIYGDIIGLIALFLLVLDESLTIKADEQVLEISQSNVLRIFATNESHRFKDIAGIEFIPAEFSFTAFLLNLFIGSISRSYKQSKLIIYKKDGETIEIKNIGSQEEIDQLHQWLHQ
jgi:hypothetical protein